MVTYTARIVGCEIMNNEITKKDLQTISYNFRGLASRLLNTDFRYAKDNLQRLMNNIDETPLISKFIEANHSCLYDMKSIVSEKGYTGIFDVPLGVKEEISFVYQLLKYILENKADYTWYVVGYGFGSSRKHQDTVNEFHKSVVNPFINHIISYFERIMIESGMKEDNSKTFIINGSNNGQINVGHNNSTINATMNINPKIDEISNLIDQFASRLSEENISEDEKEEFEELTESLKDEIKTPKPKKSIIKMATQRLKELIVLAKLSMVAGEELSEIVDMVQDIIL